MRYFRRLLTGKEGRPAMVGASRGQEEIDSIVSTGPISEDEARALAAKQLTPTGTDG